MLESDLLLILLTSLVAIAVVAKRLSIPYPIAFVIGGVGLAFVPNLPPLQLDPNLIFLIILPPLLFSGGWATDWKLFRDNVRSISLLAIGLVIATTSLVAVLVHHYLPEISWPACFALGAIVSPPDAVAAGAVFERFSVPRRIMAILDGEGLLNDATALVIYRFAIAAAVSGSFSLVQASGAFVLVAAGGVATGLAFGVAFVWLTKVMRRFELGDYQLSNILSLIAPYAVYLVGDAIKVSGVLATVTAGIYISRRSNIIFDPEARLTAGAVWDLLIFLLNGLVFLLIGFEFREVLRDPTFALRELWIGALVSLAIIVLRIAWMYPGAYLPRILFKRIREREVKPPPEYVFIIGWSGMRGIVTLAGALALPLETHAGTPFPGRQEILFISVCVVFTTLVLQGLSLIPLLKILKIDAGEDIEAREIEVRVAALRAGIGRLRQLEPEFASTVEWEVEGRIVAEYEYRIAHLLGHANSNGEAVSVNIDHRMQTEALDAERREILRMRSAGEIPDEVYRKIEYDLDLADTRLT